MRELKNDPFYHVLGQYPRCVIDYCLMEDGSAYRGMPSHKDAVAFAMQRAVERFIEEEREIALRLGRAVAERLHPWTYDISRARAAPMDAETFLYLPEVVRIDRNGTVFYSDGRDFPDENGRIPYWYAFLEPPHGNRYTPDDLRRVNAVLFPDGTDALEVYEWTTDWSDYFDAGHEWWGSACWSVYDGRQERFAVMLVSDTD